MSLLHTEDRQVGDESGVSRGEIEELLLSKTPSRQSPCLDENDTTNGSHVIHGSIYAATTSASSNGNHCNATKDKITYRSLLSKNSNFRHFLLSYLINHMGAWMTYLASLSLIQRVTTKQVDGTNQNANTIVSVLILVKLIPNVIFLPTGGVLADSYDRRRIQIALDLLSSCVVVVFLWSFYTESILLCLVANFLIETCDGLYIPSNEAMLPQLLSGNSSSGEDDDEELKKAIVLYGLSWSLMTAVGSSLGGILVATFGIQGCFVIDSITYLISAFILKFGVEGNYNASETEKSEQEDENLPLLEAQREINKKGPPRDQKINPPKSENGGNISGLDLYIRALKFLFLQEPLVGACALLKGSASLVYGAVDVLNVAFSVRGSETDPSQTSLKLGVLFGCVGVGCIIGSVVTDAFSDSSLPRQTARVCLGGFACIGIALFWMSATPDVFWSLCGSTIIRSVGSSVVWISSTLLIQKFTPTALLGRVSSFDSGVALWAEGLSALGGGMLMDHRGLSPASLSLILGCIALLFFFFWSPLAFRF